MKYTQTLSSIDVARTYEDKIGKLAKMMVDLADIKETFEFLANATKDNGDPQIAAHEALEKLGVLLAVSITYKDDYLEEANAQSSKE